MSNSSSSSRQRYDVALTYAGEQRGYVHNVARALRKLGIVTFIDEEQAVSTWGKNQIEEFQHIYMEDSQVVVMFISAEYAEKIWPRNERRWALSRALRERREYVLPVRFDDTHLPGLDPDMGYLKAADFTPTKLGAAIKQKLEMLSGVAASSKLPGC
jgi:hypothetical protein